MQDNRHRAAASRAGRQFRRSQRVEQKVLVYIHVAHLTVRNPNKLNAEWLQTDHHSKGKYRARRQKAKAAGFDWNL
jgi:hypothetical protein